MSNKYESKNTLDGIYDFESMTRAAYLGEAKLFIRDNRLCSESLYSSEPFFPNIEVQQAYQTYLLEKYLLNRDNNEDI